MPTLRHCLPLLLLLAACGSDAPVDQTETDLADAADASGDFADADLIDTLDGSDVSDQADHVGDLDLADEADHVDEPEVIEEPDGPPVSLVTVNEIPAVMNGTMAYSDDGGDPTDFTLLLPAHGFTLDILLDRDSQFIDLDQVSLTCDAAFGDYDAGDELAENLVLRPDHLRWLVAEADAVSAESVTCTGSVTNFDGEESEETTITFDVGEMTPELHPFDPPDTWLVTFSRDYYDIGLVEEDGALITSAEEGANDEADFVEDLRILGFQGQESAEGADTVEARGQVGINAIMHEWIVSETMRQVRVIYGLDPETGAPFDEDSVQLTIYLEGDEGAPDGDDWDQTFSMHGVGGDTPPEYPTAFGLATTVDVNNTSAQDDARMGYGSFTTNIARLFAEDVRIRLLLSEFLPGDGTPIGDGEHDALIVVDDYTHEGVPGAARARRDILVQEMELFTKALASLVAHEIGHSLGLIANGPPPRGLFGGIFDSSWMRTDVGGGHIDTRGMNVMQSGGSIIEEPSAIFGEVTFNPLAMAYLRGRIIVLGNR